MAEETDFSLALLETPKTGPEVIKLFLFSTQLSKKFISMINTTSERLKAGNFFICRYFIFNEQLKFLAQLLRMKKVL